MKFIKLKWVEQGESTPREMIINTSKINNIQKYYPDKLNPNNPYEILFHVGGNILRVDFDEKTKADNYFDYVMEKLRAINLKPTPW